MQEKLQRLYQEVILTHSKSPYNFEKRENPTLSISAYNPVCGDKFILYPGLKEGKIEKMHFHGFGCAISKASTSVLVKHLEGKSLAEAERVIEDFLQLVRGKGISPLEKDFEAFSAAQSFPARMTCATLSWEEMHGWLRGLDEG